MLLEGFATYHAMLSTILKNLDRGKMWDPDPTEAGVKLPIDFTAMALIHPPLLGSSNLIFPYPGGRK